MEKKSKLPRIPRSVLNERMKELPLPIQEHSQRTRKLAAYILERIAAEEWFIETGYNPQSLASAVFYHDIGKLNLAMDDMYLSGRTNAEKRARYYAHTEEGINLVVQELGADLAAYSEKSLGGILGRVIKEHHKPFNETGSTDENFERSFTLPGNLTAVVDAFDNLLFVGQGAGGDLDKAAAELKERSGKDLDPVLVDALTSDMAALEAFIGTLTNNWTYKRKQDRYGIGFTFRQVDGQSGTASYLMAEPFINDIYYGRIKTAAFMSVAEEGDAIFALDLVGLEHLASMMRRLTKAGSEIPGILYRISARQMERSTFLRRVASMLDRYGIPRNKLILALKDSDITGFHVDAKAFCREVHSEGMAFAITDLGEGNSVLTSVGDIGPDKILLAENLAEGMKKTVREELENTSVQAAVKISEPFEEYDLPFRLLEVMGNEVA